MIRQVDVSSSSSARFHSLAQQQGLLRASVDKSTTVVPTSRCGVSLSYLAALAGSVKTIQDEDQLRSHIRGASTVLTMQRLVIPLTCRHVSAGTSHGSHSRMQGIIAASRSGQPPVLI